MTPSQRCTACGAKFFVVHVCPEPEEPRRDVIQVRDLLLHIEDLEQLAKEQQTTITDLMLELADLRSRESHYARRS